MLSCRPTAFGATFNMDDPEELMVQQSGPSLLVGGCCGPGHCITCSMTQRPDLAAAACMQHGTVLLLDKVLGSRHHLMTPCDAAISHQPPATSHATQCLAALRSGALLD